MVGYVNDEWGSTCKEAVGPEENQKKPRWRWSSNRDSKPGPPTTTFDE